MRTVFKDGSTGDMGLTLGAEGQMDKEKVQKDLEANRNKITEMQPRSGYGGDAK